MRGLKASLFVGCALLIATTTEAQEPRDDHKRPKLFVRCNVEQSAACAAIPARRLFRN